MTVIIVIIVVVALLAVGYYAWTAQRHARLRRRFGPEYDRTVADHGSRREAEQELLAREKRVDELDIRPLPPGAREAYQSEWAGVQARFVDTPEDALTDADRLIRKVMTDRGYEPQGYEQRVADLSVTHAGPLEHYRAAHEISVRAAGRQASTEDLRQGMVHYRTLFQELLMDEKNQNDDIPDFGRTIPPGTENVGGGDRGAVAETAAGAGEGARHEEADPQAGPPTGAPGEPPTGSPTRRTPQQGS